MTRQKIQNERVHLLAEFDEEHMPPFVKKAKFSAGNPLGEEVRIGARANWIVAALNHQGRRRDSGEQIPGIMFQAGLRVEFLSIRWHRVLIRLSHTVEESKLIDPYVP